MSDKQKLVCPDCFDVGFLFHCGVMIVELLRMRINSLHNKNSVFRDSMSPDRSAVESTELAQFSDEGRVRML